jgi:hypothetical protein
MRERLRGVQDRLRRGSRLTEGGSMKRFGVVLAALLVAALVLPAVGVAIEPIPLEPPTPPALFQTVPAGVPLVVPGGWIAGNRGLAMKGPQFTRFYFTVTSVSGAASGTVAAYCTPSQSKLYWLPGVVHATPEMAGFDLTPFNSHIGAKPYSKEWAYPVPSGLAAGDYSFVGGFIQTRSAIDLLLWFDGQRSPYRIPASEAQDVFVWDIHVD